MPENIAITVDDTTETVSLVVTSGTVDSVFGRTGTIVAVAGDYDTDEVTEATNLYYTEARVSANSAVVLNTDKATFPEAPNDGTQYARKSLGWEAVAGGGDYADGGEAGGADRTLGNTDNFSLGFLVNNLKALLLKPITTAVNWLAISPSVTGSGVTLEAEGTDTNIDINITPKGSGVLNVNSEITATGSTNDGSTNLLELLPSSGNAFLRVESDGKITAKTTANQLWTIDDDGWTNGTSYYMKKNALTLEFKAFDNFQFDQARVIPAGDTIEINSRFSDTNGEQSGIKVNQTITQTGTAAYNGIKVDVTETTTGDGSTGDGNNLLNLAVGGVSKARIDNAGAIFSSGTPAYADEAAAVTAGLATGDIYQTTGTAASPLNVAGILMIKQ